MKKIPLRLTGRLLITLTGLWIAFAPFSRPLPGGEVFTFEANPEISCRSPLLGTFIDDRPSAEVFVTPRPQPGDSTTQIEINCTPRSRFRFGTGLLLSLVGLIYPRRIKANE